MHGLPLFWKPAGFIRQEGGLADGQEEGSALGPYKVRRQAVEGLRLRLRLRLLQVAA